MALRWYAVRTRPLAEYQARVRLESMGLEVFLPCSRTRRNRSGHEDTPLFPGYLFLRYEAEERGWRRLYRVPQVLGPVAFADEVPALPNKVIDDLKDRVAAINGTGRLWTRFIPGDRVQVSLGPIESLARVVEEALSPEARVTVLLQFLGRQVEAQVPWRDVRPPSTQGLLIGNWSGRIPRGTRGKGRWIKRQGSQSPRSKEGAATGTHVLDKGRSSS